MLKPLQQAFWQYLTEHSDRVVPLVAEHDAAQARRRMDVYHHAYWQRQLDSLLEDYPRLARLVGEEFSDLAKAYLAAHPSQSFSLRDLGCQLPEWWAANQQPLPQVELAEFERAMMDAFDARDAATLTPAALAALPPEQWPELRLQPHPASRWLPMTTNVVAWSDVDEAVDAAIEVSSFPEPVVCLIWRDNFVVYYRSLEPAEGWAWLQLLDTERFDDWCERLALRWPEEEVPGMAVNWLLRWATDGCLAATIREA